MFGLGIQELIVIFLIVFLLFGAKNLPEIARGIGKRINEFKNVFKNVNDDVDTAYEHSPKS